MQATLTAAKVQRAEAERQRLAAELASKSQRIETLSRELTAAQTAQRLERRVREDVEWKAALVRQHVNFEEGGASGDFPAAVEADDPPPELMTEDEGKARFLHTG